MQQTAIRTVTWPAVMVALLIVLGLFPGIPLAVMPVPIVLQNFAVMLVGELLGPKQGTLAVGGFLLLAALGLPVLSGGSGGVGAFLGPSGGALFAWALTPLAVGGLLKVDWLCQRAWREWLVLVVVGVLGINLAEVAWLTFGYHFAFTKALLAESLFLPGDLIKATLSVTVARRLRAIFGKGW